MADGNLPHVLVIMSDQQRADCAGYAGHPLLRTPVMDRLAGEGVDFTHAMTPAPLCMPARASFVTGTYPHNHGTWANRGLLRRDLPTLFNCFRDAGYDTALIGKAHLFAQGDVDVRTFEPVMRGYGIAQSVQVNGPRGTYKNDNNELTADWKRKGLYARYRADYEDRMRDARVVRASALPVDEHMDSWVGRRAVELIDGQTGTRPLLEEPERRHRTEVLSEVAWVGTRTTMVRTERHKYAVDGAGRPFMLYDLERDPDEQANLVGTADGAELEGALRDVLLRRLLREQFALRNDHLPA